MANVHLKFHSQKFDKTAASETKGINTLIQCSSFNSLVISSHRETQEFARSDSITNTILTILAALGLAFKPSSNDIRCCSCNELLLQVDSSGEVIKNLCRMHRDGCPHKQLALEFLNSVKVPLRDLGGRAEQTERAQDVELQPTYRQLLQEVRVIADPDWTRNSPRYGPLVVENARLLFCLNPRTDNNRLTASIARQAYSLVNFERGQKVNSIDLEAYDMRDEYRRESSFVNSSVWKHSRQISRALARFGFFLPLNSSRKGQVVCSFCRIHLIFNSSCDLKLVSSNAQICSDDYLTEYEIRSLVNLLQVHKLRSATCPRTLRVDADNYNLNRRPVSPSREEVNLCNVSPSIDVQHQDILNETKVSLNCVHYVTYEVLAESAEADLFILREECDWHDFADDENAFPKDVVETDQKSTHDEFLELKCPSIGPYYPEFTQYLSRYDTFQYYSLNPEDRDRMSKMGARVGLFVLVPESGGENAPRELVCFYCNTHISRPDFLGRSTIEDLWRIHIKNNRQDMRAHPNTFSHCGWLYRCLTKQLIEEVIGTSSTPSSGITPITNDERVIKARLEWPLVRLILVAATDIVATATYFCKNEQFFSSMNHDEQHRAIRVAVECGLYWRLYDYREDFETFQNLLESVYEFLKNMEEVGTRDPIEFAQMYNQSLEATHRVVIQQQTTNYNGGNISNTRINEQTQNLTNFQEEENLSEGTAEDLLESQSIARQTGLNVGSMSGRTSGYEGSLEESRSIDSVRMASRESLASRSATQQQTFQQATSQQEETISQSQTRPSGDTTSFRSTQSSGYSSEEPSRADALSLRGRTNPANTSVTSRSSGNESSGGIAGLECSVCRDAPVGVVLLNCGHCCACRSCASRLENCPICRQRIRGTVLIRIA